MQIQINSDRTVDTDLETMREVEDTVRSTLGRLEERITRIEVHLSDVNGAKGGRDTRCLLEARVAGMAPVAVDALTDTVPNAVRQASDKLLRLLDSRFARDRGH